MADVKKIATRQSYGEALAELGRKVVDAALDTVVLQAVHGGLYALAFFVIQVALRIAIRVLDTALRLPVPFVKKFNELGGMLLGLLKGAVIVCLGVFLLSRLGLVLTPEVLEETWLAGLIAGALGAGAPVTV